MDKNESGEPAQSRRPAARRASNESVEPVTGVTGRADAVGTPRAPRAVSKTAGGSAVAAARAGRLERVEGVEPTGPTPRVRARRSEAPGENSNVSDEQRVAGVPVSQSERAGQPERPQRYVDSILRNLAADSGEPNLAADSGEVEQAADPAPLLSAPSFAQASRLPVARERDEEASDDAALARMELAEDFGLDLGYDAKLRPLLETLCRSYFHISVSGAHNIPARGRALLVANHTRSLPWDGIMLRTALRLQHDAGRELRWLVEDDQFHAPFLGTFLSRLGAVRACQENAERLLLREELLAVFPEGNKAAQKRYDERYRLQRFGRGGYVKLALRTGAPVRPVAIVGGEDSAWRGKLTGASRWAQLPLFALRRGMPQLGPLGIPPLPSRWRIVIGAEVQEIARQDAAATSDDGLIHELNECVRSAVQQLVDASVSGNA
jgi:1-acyl-sn-glycerol-3-phosphate acyltransferase